MTRRKVSPGLNIDQELSKNSTDKIIIDIEKALQALNSNPDLNKYNVLKLMSKFIPSTKEPLDVNHQYSDALIFGTEIFIPGCTLLHMAARFDCEKIAGFLIERGAKVNLQDMLKCTPLHYATMDGDNIKVAKVLIAKGANFNKQDSYGKTTLYYARQNNYIETAKLLIDNSVYQLHHSRAIKAGVIVSVLDTTIIPSVLPFTTKLTIFAVIVATIGSMLIMGGLVYGLAYMWSKYELSSKLDEVKYDDINSLSRD